ncbi:uncharacterized protein LOC103130976 [Poecilia formosa]|uniref:uncharacterized protein LOC103130976 n=1 Tax=Poecilia formosa TaxID=48698 RepID=UPI0007B7F59F|nr:PREDICTED: uncharacterized protein LOC103130976 [Poecilia formosa]
MRNNLQKLELCNKSSSALWCLERELHPTEKFLVSVKQEEKLKPSAAQDEAAVQTGDAVRTARRKEGQNIRFGCKALIAGRTKYFCKDTCREKILVSTTGYRALRGRYGIDYQAFPDGTAIMNVSIRNLKISDSGRYRCLLEKPGVRLQYSDFDLIVTGASNTSDSNSTLGNFTSIFLSSTPVTTTAATLTQNLTSIIPKTVKQTRTTVKPKDETDQLLYVGLSLAILIILLATALLIYCRRKNLHQQKGLQLYLVLTLVAMIILLSTPLVIFCWNSRAMKSKGLQLYVFLSLVIKITLLSTPLVIFCWKRRAMKSKDSAVEAEYDDVSQINPEREENPLLYVGLSLAVLIIVLVTALLIFCQRKNLHQQKGPPVKKDPTDFTTINTVYEEIREKDRENKPPAGEITSVYAYVQSNKPNAAESNEIYSLASKPQGQAEEEDIEYSEVQLPNGAIRSNGGHLAASDNVTYSEPRLATSSGSHGNGSPPLYSTITSQE